MTEITLGFRPKGSKAERISGMLTVVGSKRTATLWTAGSKRSWMNPSNDRRTLSASATQGPQGNTSKPISVLVARPSELPRSIIGVVTEQKQCHYSDCLRDEDVIEMGSPISEKNGEEILSFEKSFPVQLLSCIMATRGAGFVDGNPLKSWVVVFQPAPDPFTGVFRSWVFQSSDFV